MPSKQARLVTGAVGKSTKEKVRESYDADVSNQSFREETSFHGSSKKIAMRESSSDNKSRSDTGTIPPRLGNHIIRSPSYRSSWFCSRFRPVRACSAAYHAFRSAVRRDPSLAIDAAQ